MFNLFLDIAPLPDDYYRRHFPKVIEDTIDTVYGFGQDITEGVSNSGGSKLPFILGAILAALVALGICIFILRQWRRKGELSPA